MKTVMRVTCMTALALVCLDGHAKAGCVTTLEAKPMRPEATTPTQRPCPTAVGHVLSRGAPGLRVANTSSPVRHA